MYDQLARLARPCLTLQQLRRASITLWMQAHPEAGRIVHGCGLGVLRHYLDPWTILVSAAPRFTLPVVCLSPQERSATRRARNELIECFDRAGREQQRLILDVARGLTTQ
jgi:hypothetical protein